MAGPWEKFASADSPQAESGPWAKFAPTQATKKTEEGGFLSDAAQIAGDALAGAVRGAGSIGATVLSPIDAAARALGVKNSFIGREDRRKSMDGALRDMGADTESLAFGGGKLGAEIAGTAGAGGALARGLSALPMISKALPFLDAVKTSGMSAGGAAGLEGLATRAAGGAITGGASAAMVNPDDAGLGAAIGAAMPVGAKLAGMAGTGIKQAITGSGVSPEVAALADRAKQLGVSIPADRLVNSRPMNAIASALNYVPMSGRAATEDAMNSQLNKALSNTFGQDSSNVTMALRKASSDLGGKFDDVLKSNTVKVDPQFMQELANIHNTASKELGSDALRPIANQVDEILAKGGTGEIDGQAAYNIKRTLDRLGRGNGPEAWHATELKKSLMEALNRSIGPEEAAAFAKTRQQYGNMLALEKIAKNGAEGEVSVARLANMRNINNKPLQELADISAQFVKPRESQHGAMQRAVAGMIGFGAGGLPALAGGATIGRLANTTLNSDALRNALLNSPGLLGAQSSGALLTGAARTAPLLPGLLD